MVSVLLLCLLMCSLVSVNTLGNAKYIYYIHAVSFTGHAGSVIVFHSVIHHGFIYALDLFPEASQGTVRHARIWPVMPS